GLAVTQDLGDDYRHVVRLGALLQESMDGVAEGLHNFLGRTFAVLADDVEDTFDPKHPIVRSDGFLKAVREQHHDLAGIKADGGPAGVNRVGSDAQGETGPLQAGPNLTGGGKNIPGG